MSEKSISCILMSENFDKLKQDVRNKEKEIGIIIELKYAENASFDKSCSEALKQINEKRVDVLILTTCTILRHNMRNKTMHVAKIGFTAPIYIFGTNLNF